MPDDYAERRRYALGQAVYERREQRGLSQEVLAALLGFDRKTISRLENGHHSITVDRFWRLADALEVTIGELEAAANEIIQRQGRQ